MSVRLVCGYKLNAQELHGLSGCRCSNINCLRAQQHMDEIRRTTAVDVWIYDTHYIVGISYSTIHCDKYVVVPLPTIWWKLAADLKIFGMRHNLDHLSTEHWIIVSHNPHLISNL